LFKAASDTFSSTPGCQVLNRKLIFKNKVQIVLMDFEGQGGLIDENRNLDMDEYS